MTREDKAWLAGWLEGEGSFIIHRSSGRNGGGQVVISGASIDADVIERVQRLIGGRLRPAHSAAKLAANPRWNQATAWSITCRIRVVAIMRWIRPLMGVRRQAQIDAALDWHYTHPRIRRQPCRS